MRLIVAHPKALPETRLEEVRWAYVDSDGAVLSSLKNALSLEDLWHSPESFQACANRQVDAYVLWCDEQISRNGGANAWVLSPYSRNPFESDQFVHLTWLTLLSDAPALDDLLLISQSPAFLAGAKALVRDRHWEIEVWGVERFLLERMLNRVRTVGRFVYDAVEVMCRWWAARQTVRQPVFDMARTDTIIQCYYTGDEVSAEGGFDSRYLPGLARFLGEAGRLVSFLPIYSALPYGRFVELLRASTRSAVPFLWPEAFWRWRDILGAILECCRYALRPGCPATRFGRLPMAEFMSGQQWKSALGGLNALLQGAVPARLMAYGLKPSIVMEWFENQPLGRASALGWSRAGSRHVGLRQYAAFQMFANLRVSAIQLKGGACPKEEWVCGRLHVGYYAHYAPELVVCVVPALRYRHLYLTPDSSNAGGDRILVLLPHSRSESEEVLRLLLSAIDMVDVIDPGAVEIKVHPDHSVGQWTSWLKQTSLPASDRVEFVTGALENCLSRAKLAVSTGSGAAVEAVCGGIPVVVVGRMAGLETNPLEGIAMQMWTKVYSLNEMCDTLQIWFNNPPLDCGERLKIGVEMRNRYFESVDGATMQAFLR